MDRRFQGTFKDKSDFPSGWWIAALRTSMDKKEFNEINDKELFDNVCERSFINGITKSRETSVIDGAIRILWLELVWRI